MSVTSIELQVISKILTSTNEVEVTDLCDYDESYYSVFKPHIKFILDHLSKYNAVPDPFTFQTEFPDITLLNVKEPLSYLKDELLKNKRYILLLETFNKLKDMSSGDVDVAWAFLEHQCDIVGMLDSTMPLNLVKDAKKRSRQVLEYAQQARIPTGFDEIDKVMYGGLSTVEELLLIIARTGTGKSWIATRMMESAQRHGFPVLYYSPEMQASFLGTRFDTWRANFSNSNLHQGKYTEEYYKYLEELEQQETDAFVVEDKDAPDEVVNVPFLRRFVKKHGIKLVVIDGLSYMEDAEGKRGDSDYIKYKNLCADLFRMSKECGCAVVVIMQANRATKDNKDDKGEVFPNIYNVEGSDHPARIATQVFAVRQVFEKHILDIRLEKARSANNQKPEFSYLWDINTGSMQYSADPNDEFSEAVIRPDIDIGNKDVTTDISGIGLSLGDTDDIDF